MPGKILITGGLGNLGSYLTKAFCTSGYEVYVLTRRETNVLTGYDYIVIESDITDINDLRKKLSTSFDYCIHTASYNEFFEENYPKNALEINSLGTRNLLEILSNQNLKRFIYLSTFHVYGINKGYIDENSSLNPKNDYASTHLFAEYYIKQFSATFNLPYTIFRLTNSYGAPLFTNSTKWYLVLNDLVRSAYNNKKIVLKSNGEASRDFIWIGDVVETCKKAIHFTKNDTYNLSSMQSYKIIDIAHQVEEVYKKRYNDQIEISLNDQDPTIASNLIVDNTKLKGIIDFSPSCEFENEINNIFNLLEGSS